MAEEVKVSFRLQPDEDGWPPVDVESVWARPGEVEGEYVIDNIPFFTREATDGDVIAVRYDIDGTLWFDKVIRSSRNSLIRVILFDCNPVDTVREQLGVFGCSTEYFSEYRVIAVNIPPNVEIVTVQSYLHGEEVAGRLAYEEAILW